MRRILNQTPNHGIATTTAPKLGQHHLLRLTAAPAYRLPLSAALPGTTFQVDPDACDATHPCTTVNTAESRNTLQRQGITRLLENSTAGSQRSWLPHLPLRSNCRITMHCLLALGRMCYTDQYTQHDHRAALSSRNSLPKKLKLSSEINPRSSGPEGARCLCCYLLQQTARDRLQSCKPSNKKHTHPQCQCQMVDEPRTVL